MVAGERVLDEPGDDLATEMVEQAIQVQKDMRLGRGEPGDIAIPELIGAGDPVGVRGAQVPRVDLPTARAIAVQRNLVAPDADG